MTTKHWRGLWLLLAMMAGAGGAAAALPVAGPDGEEPPPAAPSLWRRVSHRTAALLGKRDDPADALLTRLGAPAWHKAGHTGRGVTVAVLDSGFRGYKAALGQVAPARVAARSFRKDGRLEARDSQHGILCAEVVHRVAPGATLIFANWEPETPSSFLDAVRWARRQGARVISCSVIMPTWSDGEGGGPTHQALRRLLGEPGEEGSALFFACAGNTAQRHWGGAFSPDKDGWHQWRRGRDENGLRPLGRDRVSVELTGGGDAAYELVVRDRTAGTEVGRGRAVVRFLPAEGRRYGVRLRRLKPGAEGAQPLHLTVLGGKLDIVAAAGSVPFPGDGAAVIAVGATDEDGHRQPYSSHGPNGGRDKPDLTAAVPFPSRWRPEQPFAGTSAAAPQAAALAALVWSAHPRWTARQVRETLGAGGG